MNKIYPNDIESGNINTGNINTDTTHVNKPKSEYCEKLFAILIIGVFVLPFAITNVYYAYTDNSCVNLQAGRLYVNLKIYLAVSGIMQLCSFGINIGIIMCNNTTDIQKFYKHPLIKSIALVGNVFTLSWSIVGGIIFWSLIDNNKCDTPIYNYIYALLIISYIFIVGTIFKKE